MLEGKGKNGNVVPADAMKVYGGIILIAPLLNLDASSRGVVSVTPRPLYPRQTRVRSVGGRVGHTVDMEFVEEKSLIFLPGFEPRTVILRSPDC